MNEVGLTTFNNKKKNCWNTGQSYCEIEGLKIFGTAEKTSKISFNIEDIHPYDINHN
jgi:cysteine desulfurase/selenocysteine lyase